MNAEEKAVMGAAFSEAYASLNAAQKQAVDTIEGPVLVVAGPGTGKTQILALRIVNILRSTDTAPEQILALTFTESAKENMRERLRRYLGSSAYRVPVHTFHGFAGEIMRRYPDAFAELIGRKPSSEIERVECIELALNASGISLLRPRGNPSYYVKPLLHQLEELKQEAITPDFLAKIIDGQKQTLVNLPQFHEKGAHKGKERSEYTKLLGGIKKNEELLQVYRHYEALLKERGRCDFADVLLSVIEVMKTDESLKLALQEEY